MSQQNQLQQSAKFGIPILGRREHHELISRIWLSRDVRSLHTFQFQHSLVDEIVVNFFHPQVSTIFHSEYSAPSTPVPAHHNNKNQTATLSRTVASSVLMMHQLHNEKQWWDQKAMDDANKRGAAAANQGELSLEFHPASQANIATSLSDRIRKQNKACPWMHSYFWDSSLNITIPRADLHNPSLWERWDSCDGEGDELSIAHRDRSCDRDDGYNEAVTFIPFFNQSPVIPSPIGPKVDDFFNSTIPCALSIHNVVPRMTASMKQLFTPGSGSELKNYPYEIDSELIRRISHRVLSDLTHVPFLIIAIDLCDESSLAIAAWSYHLLLYLYNTSSSFPNSNTTILIIFFNQTALDHQLATTEDIFQWFSNFPFHIEFTSYTNLFLLPDLTEMDDSCRTISTLPRPDDSRQNNNQHIFTPTELEPNSLEELANIALASTLDRLFVSQIQSHYIKDFLNEVGWETLKLDPTPNKTRTTETALPPQLPCPVSSAVRYPFQSMVGKPIAIRGVDGCKLKVPSNLPHWCLVDRYSDRCSAPSHNNNNDSSSSKAQTSESGIQHQSEDTNPEHNPPHNSHHHHHHNNNNNAAFNPYEPTHTCITLPIQYIQLTGFDQTSFEASSNSAIQDRVIEAIGSKSIDFFAIPFSISPDSPLPSSPILPPSHPLPTPSSTLRFIKQRFDLTTHPSPQYFKIILDRYSTPLIQPILEYPTTVSLGSDGRMQLVAPSSINSSLTSQTQPTTTTTATTTVLRSHNFTDRYYSTMHIDTQTKEILDIERPSLINLGLESSQLVSLYPINATTMITQLLMQDETNNEHKQQSTPSPTPTVNINLNPLTSQLFHFRIPLIGQVECQRNILTDSPVISTNLLSLSIMNLSTLRKEVNALQGFHKRISKQQNPTSTATSQHSQLTHFSTPYDLHTHTNQPPNQAKSLPFRQSLPRNQCENTNNVQIRNSTTTSTHPHQRHALTSLTLDHPHAPTLDSFDLFRFCNDEQLNRVIDQTRENLMLLNPSTLPPHRQLLPYFLIIINDDLETQTASNENNSEFSGLITKYLSSPVIQACPSYNGDMSLFYCLISEEQLKHTLIECVQTAIGFRMDHYATFDPIYR